MQLTFPQTRHSALCLLHLRAGPVRLSFPPLAIRHLSILHSALQTLHLRRLGQKQNFATVPPLQTNHLCDEKLGHRPNSLAPGSTCLEYLPSVFYIRAGHPFGLGQLFGLRAGPRRSEESYAAFHHFVAWRSSDIWDENGILRVSHRCKRATCTSETWDSVPTPFLIQTRFLVLNFA